MIIRKKLDVIQRQIVFTSFEENKAKRKHNSNNANNETSLYIYNFEAFKHYINYTII